MQIHSHILKELTKKVDTFLSRCLRQMLKNKQPEKIQKNEVLLRGTEASKVSNKIANRKQGWCGHVLKMDNTRICTTALIRHPEGRRKVQAVLKLYGGGPLSKNEESLIGIVRCPQKQQPRTDKDFPVSDDKFKLEKKY